MFRADTQSSIDRSIDRSLHKKKSYGPSQPRCRAPATPIPCGGIIIIVSLSAWKMLPKAWP